MGSARAACGGGRIALWRAGGVWGGTAAGEGGGEVDPRHARWRVAEVRGVSKCQSGENVSLGVRSRSIDAPIVFFKAQGCPRVYRSQSAHHYCLADACEL